MLFTSFDFLLFFVVVFALQAALPHRPRNLFLLAASYFFYGCWDWRFLSLILISTLVDYACSHGIAASQSTVRRKMLLTVSLATNLSILGFFKYANFFVDSDQELLTTFDFSGNQERLTVSSRGIARNDPDSSLGIRNLLPRRAMLNPRPVSSLAEWPICSCEMTIASAITDRESSLVHA